MSLHVAEAIYGIKDEAGSMSRSRCGSSCLQHLQIKLARVDVYGGGRSLMTIPFAESGDEVGVAGATNIAEFSKGILQAAQLFPSSWRSGKVAVFGQD